MNVNNSLRDCAVVMVLLSAVSITILGVAVQGCSDASPTNDVANGGTGTRFSGTWVSESVLNTKGKKKIIRMTFPESRRVAWEISLIQPPSVFHAFALFEYEEVNNGRMQVRMISRKSGGPEGEEVIRPEDKRPREWAYRFESDTEMRLRMQRTDGTYSETVFRRVR